MIDIETWMPRATEALKEEFGDRLLCVGLQGSRLRGEARPDSDIDILIIVDELGVYDLDRMRAAIRPLPESERAAGFTCGRRELAAWPKYELFQFLRVTRCWHGDLASLLPALDASDIRYGAQVEVANLYHMTAHSYLTVGCRKRAETTATLQALCKASFFALQMVTYLRCGEFAATKRDLLALLRSRADTDAEDSATGIALLRYSMDPSPLSACDAASAREVYGRLLDWCAARLREFGGAC